MKGIKSKRRWVGGLALCLVLSHSLLAATQDDVAEPQPIPRVLVQHLAGLPESNLPIDAFYRLHENQPVWQEEAAVEALVKALQHLEEDGLEPENYQASQLLAAYRQAQQADANTQAAFELRATRQLLLALNHLERGKIDPRETVENWEAELGSRRYNLAKVVQGVDARNLDAVFALARPATSEYRSLRDALRYYRGLANQPEQASLGYLPSRDEALRPGMTHEDVALLRRRLVQVGEPEVMRADSNAYPEIAVRSPQPLYFDETLEAAVKRFQRRHLLEADGVIGRQTLAALNTSLSSRIDQLRVNLERARWLTSIPRDTPRVWVDVAGYRLHYFRPDGGLWTSKVVVGRAGRDTPIIHSAITHLTLNPSWTLPPTILREDVLPEVRRDQEYLARKNIRVLNANGEPLSSDSIDWSAPGNIMLRQVAGPGNPLGDVVIRFPNDHMIYLHDTPAQGLFRREQRALSSGCIRVENAEEFAQLLLEDSGSKQRLSRLLNGSGSDRTVRLPQHIPVALDYLTAWPDAQGNVEFRPDIYQRDQKVLAELQRSL
ncbi:L,D-transpeptidase family protein [Vreelandella rituensis]|uniref:Murein L,D-transpeptidase n=3 Tax=Vreelandella rituensis TaxID=2282306 RepID=A0A368U7F9_9GAMM|nr:L,D-transpeptidase family protein [Halomonas rituensis]RCV92915.1 murein L,D-transpeptidase [Halomonas rituensis]